MTITTQSSRLHNINSTKISWVYTQTAILNTSTSNIIKYHNSDTSSDIYTTKTYNGLKA